MQSRGASRAQAIASQMSSTPVGSSPTGGGSTAGIQDEGVLAIGGHLQAGAIVSLALLLTRLYAPLTALANATTNCFPMILISGSSEREIVDLQQGDYEEMDQLSVAKPLCKRGPLRH